MVELSDEDLMQGYSLDNIFITSDLHLYHTNIIKYCNRPFEYSEKGCQEMNEFLLKKFDALPEDCLIWNFGDVYLNRALDHAKIMNTVLRMKKNRKMCLILGNHDLMADKKPYSNYKEYFKYLGFDKVYKGPLLYKNYILSHEPVLLDSKSNVLNIHGHTHDKFVCEDYFLSEFNRRYTKEKIDPEKYINVCMDANNFEILHFKDLILN